MDVTINIKVSDRENLADSDAKYVEQSINLEINSKSIFWIQGYNGSGKSTLMKIIASQIEDYEGNVSYKNISIKKIGYEIHNEIFYLPSLSNLYEGLTIDENIYFFSNRIFRE